VVTSLTPILKTKDISVFKNVSKKIIICYNTNLNKRKNEKISYVYDIKNLKFIRRNL